jgi:hypothetical protein
MIPTVEELSKEFELETRKGILIHNSVYAFAKHFARLHVEAALKAAADNVDYESVPYTDEYTISKHSILSAYPLKNIK